MNVELKIHMYEYSSEIIYRERERWGIPLPREFKWKHRQQEIPSFGAVLNGMGSTMHVGLASRPTRAGIVSYRISNPTWNGVR